MRDSAISIIMEDEPINGRGRELDGLNGYFGENWARSGFIGAITRGWPRNKTLRAPFGPEFQGRGRNQSLADGRGVQSRRVEAGLSS